MIDRLQPEETFKNESYNQKELKIKFMRKQKLPLEIKAKSRIKDV